MVIEQSGEPEQEFRPSRGNIFAGIIIAILLIVGGCALVYFYSKQIINSNYNLPLWAEKGEKDGSWGAFGGFIAIGIGMIVGAFFLLRWLRSLWSFRIVVRLTGFSVIERQSTRVFAWEDILSVQEIHLYERLPVLKGVARYALPKMRSKRFKVKVNEGREVVIDGDTIKGHNKLAKLIREETDLRKIPWEIVEQHN